MKSSCRPRQVVLLRSAFTGFRFPAEVITGAVRWYLRFGLSYRDVEELLAERGVEGDHVTAYRASRCAPTRARNQFGGLKADDAKRLKDLERENATLKRLLADMFCRGSFTKLILGRLAADVGWRCGAGGRQCSPMTVVGQHGRSGRVGTFILGSPCAC